MDVIIIGGGTAGLTAAIYLQRNALQSVVLEAEAYGGRIYTTPSVDNYPAMPGVSGFDFGEKLRAQAEALGAELINESASELVRTGNLWQVKTHDSSFTAQAVIYAAGEKHRKLGVPGESELFGRGVSICAACDGAFFRNKDVAVIGGGDKALDEALALSIMCNSVRLIHRRDEFRAAGSTVARVKETPNIIMHLNCIVDGIGGTSRVENIMLRCAEGGESETFAVSGVFVAIGSVPQTAICADFVRLDEQGYIIAGEDCMTSAPGLFVAGDVRHKPFRQLVTAAADGAVAAKAATDYITHKNKD